MLEAAQDTAKERDQTQLKRPGTPTKRSMKPSHDIDKSRPQAEQHKEDRAQQEHQVEQEQVRPESVEAAASKPDLKAEESHDKAEGLILKNKQEGLEQVAFEPWMQAGQLTSEQLQGAEEAIGEVEDNKQEQVADSASPAENITFASQQYISDANAQAPEALDSMLIMEQSVPTEQNKANAQLEQLQNTEKSSHLTIPKSRRCMLL